MATSDGRVRLPTVRGLQQAALTVGTALATLLLTLAAWPLVRTNVLVGVGVTVGMAATLWVSWSNLWALQRSRQELAPLGAWKRASILGAFPVSLVGSVYSCSGFRGCTSVCAFLDNRWVPLLAVVTIIYLVRPYASVLVALTPFAAGMMVIGAAASHRRLLATALIAWTIAGGLLGFHVGHHYFHWPW